LKNLQNDAKGREKPNSKRVQKTEKPVIWFISNSDYDFLAGPEWKVLSFLIVLNKSDKNSSNSQIEKPGRLCKFKPNMNAAKSLITYK